MQRRSHFIRMTAAALPAVVTLAFAIGTPAGGPQMIHADEPMVLAVIGDYGTNNSGEYAVSALVRSWQPDAIATVGDNMYLENPGLAGLERYDLTVGNFFCAFLGGSTAGGPECSPDPGASNRFFPAAGNHDYEDGRIDSYLDYFDLPGPGAVSRTPSGSELYYDVDLGDVHLFVLDSQVADGDPTLPGLVPLATQRAWLESALEASTAPWQLVLFHHPPYSSGGPRLNHAVMQWPFAEWGADMVLSGHHHAYERIERDGIVYQVVGLGGAGRYPFGEPIEGSVVRYNADEGALRLTIDDSQLVGEFFAVDGTMIDRYVLTAPVAPPTTEPPATTEPPTTEPPTTEPPATTPPGGGGAGGTGSGGGGSGAPSGPGTPSDPILRWERLGGADRYATAVAVSRRLDPGIDTLSLVAGHSFADAVAAASTADGPILLTARTGLPAVVAAELVRLQPQRVLIIGGEEAISPEVEGQVRELLDGAVVERLAGADRYETTARVVGRRSGAVDTLWLASGERFPDALAAAAAARTGGASHAVLLTRSAGLPGSVADLLDDLRPRRIVVVGGAAAVSEAVVGEVARLTGATVTRLAGTDRQTTAIAVADWLRNDVVRTGSFGSVHLATDAVFADALSAVALAGPLLYTSRDCLPVPVGDSLRRWGPERVVLLGGEAAVGPGVPGGVSCGPR